MAKFRKGHKYYPRSIEGILAMKEKMSGERNPAKRPEVKIKISLKRKGSNGRLGISHSEKTKKKISKAHKGKKKPWAGKFITDEGREKLSENHKGKENKFWKGGISPLYAQIRNLFKYRQWRSDIFKRDNFTCQICGIKGGYLEVDHCPQMRSQIIKEYDIKSVEDALACDDLWRINNGRTLCKPCHDKTKYGRPNKKI